MDSFLPYGFLVTLFLIFAFYTYLKVNEARRTALTSSQISFLREAAEGNATAEQLITMHAGEKMSPREYANLRARVDSMVSNSQKYGSTFIPD